MSRKKAKRSAPKAHYDASELHFSPAWCTEKFRSADKQREIDRDAKKQAETDSIYTVIGVIHDEKLLSFPALVQYVGKHLPQYRVTVTHNHQLFRNYIRDFADYTKYFDEIVNKYEEKQKSLEEKYRILFEDECRDHAEMIQLLRNQRQDLIDYINRLHRSPEEIKKLSEIYAGWLKDAGLLSRVDETFSEIEQSEIRQISVLDAYNINDEDVPY